ncbi:hypothetical protein UY3_19000 [Chelonia mydas]|uniref:Uncharacterized protein n=1 Tax=Chelonia mydas TaxID=8469 RepID=M7AVZ6_CHEMY|nr:hypothetical protein UY3_19000 [Chelonia mydas]
MATYQDPEEDTVTLVVCDANASKEAEQIKDEWNPEKRPEKLDPSLKPPYFYTALFAMDIWKNAEKSLNCLGPVFCHVAVDGLPSYRYALAWKFQPLLPIRLL